MHLLARLVLSLILLLQPSFGWAGGDCADSHKKIAEHNCCCGEACPSIAAQHAGEIAAFCHCSSNEPARPAPLSKHSKDSRIDVGTLVPALVLPAAPPLAMSMIRPQVECIFPSTRSINSFLCVWLT